MGLWFLRGPTSSSPMKRCSCRSRTREPWICRRSRRLVSESAVFEEDRPMKPDESANEKTERVTPVADGEKPHAEREVGAGAPELQEPQHPGFAAHLRQIMQRLPQGEARSNIKREQLKENRTKSFLLLAGLTVVLALAFFA